MVPFGAGSGLEGGAVPAEGGVSIDLGRLDQVVAVNAADMDATVQAGVRRRTLNSLLRDTGLFFPVDPGADATIGGMVATRASGTNAVRFGTMRENVLGLTVVLADGRVIRTGGRARKSASGYDLTRLFVGSEGTLGIVTEVTLRLHPIPEVAAVAVCSFPTLHQAVRTSSEVIQYGIPIGRVELLDDALIEAVLRHTSLDLVPQPTLFFEFHGGETLAGDIAGQVAEIVAAHGGSRFHWATAPEERERLWEARRDGARWAKQERPGARTWPTDVCVPISALADCIAATKADIASTSVPAYILGHVGDGNFHCAFHVDPDDPAELAEVEALSHRLAERAIAAGGTCTGEHGIGIGKRGYLAAEHGDGAVEVMRAIKAALDPFSLLNPGTVLP
jgi:FAD/FMN-containing dehydrogenases